MKIRHPALIRVAAWLCALVVKAWLATLRYRIETEDGRDHPADPEHVRHLYVVWHEHSVIPAKFRVPVRVLISRHADGELIARICHSLGLGTIRGSTSRGGVAAVLAMIKASRSTHLYVTPDGPRGPRRQVQGGAVFLAAQTGLPIVALGVACKRGWRARSWDRFLIPKPFAAVHVVVGAPLAVPSTLDKEGHDAWKSRIEAELGRVTARAEFLAGVGGPSAVPRPHLAAAVESTAPVPSLASPE